MDGLSTSVARCGQTVEFKGHLIDSLTLSKIADQILRADGYYELNDIRVGTRQKDFSSVSMTVFAENETRLKDLMETLKPYGAIPAGSANAETVRVAQDGVAPDTAFTLKMPKRVFVEGQWLTLQDGESLFLKILAEQGAVRPVKASDLRQGDRLVSGSMGIEWS